MSRREKKLVAAVVLLIAAASAMAVWMQRRTRDVEDVLQDFADLERQLESSDPAGLSARRLRELRPRLQTLILEREYAEARTQMEALKARNQSGAISLIRFDKSLSMNQLLPPQSAERRRARQLLVALVEREQAGYDTEPVRTELARMGGCALRGDRVQALQCLERAQKALKGVRKIPGFEKLVPDTEGRRALRPGLEGFGGLPHSPLAGGGMAGVAQSFQALPPRLQARLQSLGLRLAQAYQQGLDVASLQPLLQELGRAVQKGQTERVRQLLRRIEMGLTALPPRVSGPAALPGRPAGPKAGPPAGKGPLFILPALPSPFWSSQGRGAGKPAPAELTPMILAALDRIRAMPAEEYRKQRPFLVQIIGQLLHNTAGWPSPAAPAQPARPASGPAKPGSEKPLPPTVVLAIGKDSHLELSSTGQIVALHLGQRPLPLSENGPSGFCLERPSEAPWPLPGTLRGSGSQALQRPQNPSEGLQLNAVYTAEERGLVVRARLILLDREPSPVRLSYRIPLDAVGWLWGPSAAGPEERVEIQADQVYQATSSEGLPWRAVLSGEAGEIRIETSVAQAELGYDGRDRVLFLSFPVSFSSPTNGRPPSVVITFLLQGTFASSGPAEADFPPFPPAEP